ncbi:MAG: hypothetical protein IPG22_05680 [Acidobacteria bacterium]|jgi:hypothetical protein|nr:hypothetical protein [Acidobacteriota bacterium]
MKKKTVDKKPVQTNPEMKNVVMVVSDEDCCCGCCKKDKEKKDTPAV